MLISIVAYECGYVWYVIIYVCIYVCINVGIYICVCMYVSVYVRVTIFWPSETGTLFGKLAAVIT